MGLLEEFRSIESGLWGQARGKEFERFVAKVFRSEHFRVAESPGTGGKRQVDAHAVLGQRRYLVEAKWDADKAGDPEIVQLHARLRLAVDAIGVLVSFNGFTDPAVDTAQATPELPVLFVSGNELIACLDKPRELLYLLERKHHRLVQDGAVSFDDDAPLREPKKRPVSTSARSRFVVGGTDRSAVLRGGGNFDRVIFVDELPDVDWAASKGRSVAFDCTPRRVTTEESLLAAIQRLAATGWDSDRARWTIERTGASWYGMGQQQLIEALPLWKDRDSVGSTERVLLYDVESECPYTLAADITNDAARQAFNCRLSFLLPGIPLDVEPLRNLVAALEVADQAYFRPLDGPTLTRVSIEDDVRLPAPSALVVENHESSPDPLGEMVTGFVTTNVLTAHAARLPGLPSGALSSELIICELGSWHPIDQPPATYRLTRVEWTETSDTVLLRLVADWD